MAPVLGAPLRVARRIRALDGASAAASMSSGVAAPASAAVARSGVAPMFMSAIAALSTVPFDAATTAATPTVAQSCARRRNFRYDQPAAAELRHADLGQDVLRARARSRRRRGRTLPRRPSARRPALGSSTSASSAMQHRRQVGRRVAVRERAADRAAMAHLRIADHARPRSETSGQCSCSSGSCCDVVVPRQRADRERVAGVAHVATARRCARRRRAAPAARTAAAAAAAASGRRRAASRPRATPSSSTACSTDSATS